MTLSSSVHSGNCHFLYKYTLSTIYHVQFISNSFQRGIYDKALADTFPYISLLCLLFCIDLPTQHLYNFFVESVLHFTYIRILLQ
jgi:hypothetical protein